MAMGTGDRVSSEDFDRPVMTERAVGIELFSASIYLILVSLILMQQHLRRSEEGYVYYRSIQTDSAILK